MLVKILLFRKSEVYNFDKNITTLSIMKDQSNAIFYLKEMWASVRLKSNQGLSLKAEKTFRLCMIMLGNERFRSDLKSLQIWNDNSQKQKS